jgi:hypothetical protein
MRSRSPTNDVNNRLAYFLMILFLGASELDWWNPRYGGWKLSWWIPHKKRLSIRDERSLEQQDALAVTD